MKRSTRIFVAAVLASAVTVSGCTAQDTVSGSAVETRSGEPATATERVLVPAAPGELDPGTNATSAMPEGHGNDVELDAATGGLVESQRLAEFVTLPTEVDAGLVDLVDKSTGTLATPAHVARLLDDAGSGVRGTLTEFGYYAGFSSTRRMGLFGTNAQQLKIAVLVFPNSDSARAAAGALHQDQMSATPSMTNADGEPYDGRLQERPIPGMADSFTSANIGAKFVTASAFTPHGRYVIYTWSDAPASTGDWAYMVLADALAQQKTLIDRFPVTEPSDVTTLPMDIDGVLRLTVPYGKDDEAIPNSLAVYGPRGLAHLSDDQAGILTAMTDTDTDRVGILKTMLYRSRTAAAAEELFDRLASIIRTQRSDTAVTGIDGPPGVPNTRCFTVIDPRTSYVHCVMVRGRYVAEATGADSTDAHQTVTAQYMILGSEA